MSNTSHSSKLSHGLRIIIFLLRLALGLDFFYIGFAVIFNKTLGQQLGGRSFNALYAWLANPSTLGWIHSFAQWAFLLIGVCLIIGLATRIASILGILLTGLSFIPNVSYTALNAQQFINDDIIVILCLFILIFANAGNYLGVDNFIHISFRKKD